MLKEFKKFILRGNVVDLAVAVVVGGAFGAIVTALVKDLATPLLAAIGGQPDFSRLTFTINGSKFLYGDFINAVVAFVLIAAVIFFLVVQPLNSFQSRINRRKTPEEPTDRKCPECLSEIPKAASRCRFCTAKVEPVVK
ncbi:MAG TPA: large conductance mechanosensitive channel protein MscL [Candidatus Saccharimonadales bacterium]|nr:large conductance mechanosensitive channel protein MscL [Candidatus Saccharimonadales bacterium]